MILHSEMFFVMSVSFRVSLWPLSTLLFRLDRRLGKNRTYRQALFGLAKLPSVVTNDLGFGVPDAWVVLQLLVLFI